MGKAGTETMDTSLRVGETVVEPTIGICTIAGIREIQVDGNREDYFIFQSPSARVMVPRSQLAKRGIRRPMSREEVKKLTNTLKVPVNHTRGDAREQYLEYQEILRSGDPTRISKLLRKLFILNQADDLKGKEKELMEQARKFLADEIMFIEGGSKTKTIGEIDECLKAMYKKKVQQDKEDRAKSR